MLAGFACNIVIFSFRQRLQSVRAILIGLCSFFYVPFYVWMFAGFYCIPVCFGKFCRVMLTLVSEGMFVIVIPCLNVASHRPSKYLVILSQVSSALYTRDLLQHSPLKGQVVFFQQLHNAGGVAGVGFSWSNLWLCFMIDVSPLGCCSCPDLFGFFSTFFKIGVAKENQRYKV